MPRRLLLFALITGLAACSLPAASQPAGTAPPVARATASAGPASATGPAEHRIRIRSAGGQSEFYDRLSGDKFVPRGNNYIRLGPQTGPGGESRIYHTVFDPGKYDSARVRAALAAMHAGGYNVVRVFLSQNTIGAADGGGLSSEYMENVAAFVRRAKENGLVVIFAQDWLPDGRYGEILGRDCCDRFTLMNVHFLSAAGVAANRAFFQDFVRALIARDAPLDAVFSYELRNELFFDSDQVPLSLTSGTILAGDGQNYDMSRNADKQRMLEENLVYWIDQVRAAILEVDPTALVSVGFFQPQAPNPTRQGDARLVVVEPALQRSQADFIDLHAYPGSDLTLKQYAENFGLIGFTGKPVIMGEFGASVHSYASPAQAAQALMDWQVESCQYGFQGWLLWDWDTAEDAEFFDATQAGGEIDQALAPVNRPDPCQPGSLGFIETDLARGKPARVSRALDEQPGASALDGTAQTLWNSGAGAPQWIEIDLGAPVSIAQIRLVVSQYPDGATVHQVWAGSQRDRLVKVREFSADTTDGQVLLFEPQPPLTQIRFLRVVTVQSPSWVAWREIELFAPGGK